MGRNSCAQFKRLWSRLRRHNRGGAVSQPFATHSTANANFGSKYKEGLPVYRKSGSLDAMEDKIIGRSTAFQYVLNQVRVIAKSDSVILIHGETGTGKEVIARAIHDFSFRKHGPMVKLNCAAIPGPLLESEMFGHERGAFTGAVTHTKGRFQQADQGTLFLDEIGDLPLELQPNCCALSRN